MLFRPSIDRLVIATHNNGKLREFTELLGGFGTNVVSAGQLGLPSPEETGKTFAENAVLKAMAASEATNLVALSDDSGLCVHALDDQPGIYSARWAEPDKDFNRAMLRIQTELGSNPDRSAHFICVLALYWPEGLCHVIEGRIDGRIALTPRGDHGHGYDPIFIPDGFTMTFAEMSEQQKNTISHRGRATQELVEMFFERPALEAVRA